MSNNLKTIVAIASTAATFLAPLATKKLPRHALPTAAIMVPSAAAAAIKLIGAMPGVIEKASSVLNALNTIPEDVEINVVEKEVTEM